MTPRAAAPAREVGDCFADYEAALTGGDTERTNHWFADDERVVRFGVAEEQWGGAEVRRWRRTAPPVPAGRRLERTRVDAWDGRLAVVTTLFDYPGVVGLGRQSQAWLRTEQGWRIVHAHVSHRYPDP